MTRTAKMTLIALAAAAILGGGLIAAAPHRVPVAEACVIRAIETGTCVIPGRPLSSASLTPSPDGKAREDEREDPEPVIIRTADLHTEIRHVVGILPIARENTNHTTQAQEAQPARRYLGRYYITGYDTCASCCGKGDGITASGTQATVGRTCAAASFLPFGTRIYIDGLGERTVEDRGGGVNGEHIDVLCENHPQCYAITGYYDVYIMED